MSVREKMNQNSLKKYQQLLPEIPRQKNQLIVTRFSIEPSGYLHLGHLKSLVLNWVLAEKYLGICSLRFDDVNSKKIQLEHQTTILEDLDRLGFKYPTDRISYSSSYFGRLLEVADQLVADGKAYVDQTDLEEMKKLRRLGIASDFRSRPLKVQVVCWQWLKEGKINGCLRLKIKIDHVYDSMRDPVIYHYCRDSDGQILRHLRVNAGPVIYPTYDFACPLIDSWEGITHVCRSDKYFDQNDLYHWVLKELGLPMIHLVKFSRLEMRQSLTFEQSSHKVVTEQKVDWIDPRMPTIRGSMNQGAIGPALIRLVTDQGLVHHSVMLDCQKLWVFNKQELGD